MAVKTQEVILTFNAQTGEVLSATNAISDNLNAAAKSAENMDDAIEDSAENAKALGKETKKAKKEADLLGRGFTKAGKLGQKAMTKVKTALKAAGIGLLLGILAGIGQAFMANKERAEKFEVVMAKLRIVFTVIADALANMLPALIQFFSDGEYRAQVFRSALEGIGKWFSAGFTRATAGFRKSLKRLGITFYETLESMSFGTADFSDKIAGLNKEIEDIDAAVAEAQETMAGSFFAPKNIKGYIDGLKAYEEAQAKITKRMQELRDAQRNLDVETAQSQAQIEQLKKTRDDERLSFEERIEASKEAQAIEQNLADKQVRIARANIKALKDQIALQGETEENLQALADARIAEADAMSTSAGVQTELMTSLFTINNDIKAQEDEIASLRRGWSTERLEGLEAEKASIEEQFQSELTSINALRLAEDELETLREEAKVARDKRIEKAEEEHLAEMARKAEEARLKEEEDGNDAAEKALKLQQELAQKRVELTVGALGALQALNDAFSKDDERSAKRAFNRNKALALATATVNTGQAVVNALTAGGNPIKLATGAQFVEAGIAAATGAAQIATILKSKFTPTGAGGVSTSGVSSRGAGGGSSTQAPQLDLSFLGEGAGQAEPIQAYVVAQDVSNAQQANQQIQDQATL